jgi:hypothetical protein
MGRASCSHYLPLCSPSSRRARNRRIVLTLSANDESRARRRGHGASLGRHRARRRPAFWAVGKAFVLEFRRVGRGVEPWKSRRASRFPAFSKAVRTVVFREVTIENRFENAFRRRNPVRCSRSQPAHKSWLSRRAAPGLRSRIPVGSQCEHDRPLASTAR